MQLSPAAATSSSLPAGTAPLWPYLAELATRLQERLLQQRRLADGSPEELVSPGSRPRRAAR